MERRDKRKDFIREDIAVRDSYFEDRESWVEVES